jgi:ABC-2 type transport system permease protein
MSTATVTDRPAGPRPALDGAETARRAWRGASTPTQVRVLTGRSLRALVNDPRTVIFSLLQPLILLVLFSQVFGPALGGAVTSAGGNYIDFLMPAILVTTGLGSALQSGVGLITDMKNGVITRFRALPIRLGSVLLARSLADLARTGTQLIVLLVLGWAVFGFSPVGGLPGIVAALGVALLVSWSLTWLFLAIAAWVRKEEVMQSVGFLATFPLMFASSAFVPLDVLPGWLRAVAAVNPLTYAVDASRALSLAQPALGGVLAAVGVSAALVLIAGRIAIVGFRRPS